jgi:hypothetical protein
VRALRARDLGAAGVGLIVFLIGGSALEFFAWPSDPACSPYIVVFSQAISYSLGVLFARLGAT